MPQTDPQISVVIPAHNASHTIVRVLEALLASVDVAPEVVVVDDGSTDQTAALVERFPVTLILRTVCGGPAAARNQGVAAAAGHVVVFIDADVEVGSHTLARIKSYMAEHQEVDAIFGSYDRSPAGRRFISRYRNLMHHFVHQRGSVDAGTFWCGCGAVRREVYLELGGLREDFARPSIEDIEFGARLDAAGHTIHLVKEIQVKHLKQWSLWQMIRTDFRDRAIPWTLLLLSGKCRRWDLNLQLRHRASAAATFGGLASLVLALAVHPLFLLPLMACALVFHLVNRDLLRFFVQSEGLGFALLTLPFLLLFYVYSSLAFGTALLLHLFGKRLG